MAWKDTDKGKAYILNYRKTVTRIKQKEYRKTLYGKLNNIYYSMKERSKKKRWLNIISKEDFLTFALNSNFEKLYINWVKSNYSRKFIPSIDRINNNVGYIKGNLQFLTLQENIIKGCNIDRIVSNYSRGHEIVIKKGNIELTFKSKMDLAKYLNITKAFIYKAIKRNWNIRGWKIISKY